MNINIRKFFFQNTGIRQTVLKNTFWSSLAEFTARFLSLILVIYIARVLGATEYGKFTFALSFASLMVIFADLGIIDISTREFARNVENEEKLNSTFTLGAVLGITTLMVTIISSFFITADMFIRIMIWTLIMVMLANNLFGILFAFLRARQKMEYEAGIKIFQSFINVLVVFFAITYFPTALQIGYGYLASTIICLIFILLFFGKHFKPIALTWNKNMFHILKISWPLSFGFVAGWVYIMINSIMLGYFNLNLENGWYGAASRIAIASMIVANLVVRSFYPLLSNIFYTSKEKIKGVWNYLAESMVFLMVPIVIGGVTLAPKIIYSFYGQSFVPSILALQLFMVIVLISFINYPYTIMLVVSDHQRQNFILMVLGALINIVLDIILIPSYGFYGSIVATIIASLVVLCATVGLSKWHQILIPFNKRFFTTSAMSVFAGYLMYLVISFAILHNVNIIWTFISGSVGYLVVFSLLYALYHRKSVSQFLKS